MEWCRSMNLIRVQQNHTFTCLWIYDKNLDQGAIISVTKLQRWSNIVRAGLMWSTATCRTEWPLRIACSWGAHQVYLSPDNVVPVEEIQEDHTFVCLGICARLMGCYDQSARVVHQLHLSTDDAAPVQYHMLTMMEGIDRSLINLITAKVRRSYSIAGWVTHSIEKSTRFHRIQVSFLSEKANKNTQRNFQIKKAHCFCQCFFYSGSNFGVFADTLHPKVCGTFKPWASSK